LGGYRKASADEGVAGSGASSIASVDDIPPPPLDMSEEDRKAVMLAETMKANPEMQRRMRENVRDFLKSCQIALRTNNAMNKEQVAFNTELTNGFEKLCNELYPYVGAIPGLAGVMNHPLALQTAGISSGPSASTSNVKFVVNGNLIPSMKNEKRRSRRMRKGSSGCGSGIGTSAAGTNTGSAAVSSKIIRSDSCSTIPLSVAQKRADESVDGDPNSFASVGNATPSSSRAARKAGKGLIVTPCAAAGTPLASSSTSVGGIGGGGNSTSATPLKARVPSSSYDSSPSFSNDDDSNSASSIGTDSDEEIDIIDMTDVVDDDLDAGGEGEADPSPKPSPSKKSSHHHHHHHHKKSTS